MYRAVFVLALAAFGLALMAPSADAGNGPFYGYGFQWLRDDDGDGIPNHMDDDWVRPEDGTGYKMKHGNPFPSAGFFTWSLAGDQLRDKDKDRDQLQDRTKDQIRLRLKDESCK